MLRPVDFLVATKTATCKEGFGFKAEDIKKAICAGAVNWAMLSSREPYTSIKTAEGVYIMSDIEVAYENANEVIGKAQDQYNNLLQKFRGTIKNDLTSISSSADKTVKECEKIQKSYAAAADLLTSEKMLLAIANAERLAAAFEILSKVQSTELNLTLLDKR